MKKAFLLCVLLVSAVSCATTGEVDRLQYQLRQQEMKNRQLEQTLSQTAVSLQDEINKQSTPVRSTQANLNAEFEQMRVRMGAMEGQIEDMRRQVQSGGPQAQRIDALQAQVQAIRTALQSQLGMEIVAEAPMHDTGVVPPAGAQGQQAPAAPQAPGGYGAPAVVAPGPAVPGQAVPPQQAQADPAQALYDQAVRDFNSGKYKESLANATDFLKNYPKHPLVPNAYFWQGESYFQLKEYAQAALAYQEIIDKHNKSNKYPDALLKQGLALQKLEKPKAARDRFQELVKKFPGTPQAKRAEVELSKK